MKYHQLTSEQRYTISVLLKKKRSVKDIADTINVHYSTVYRELKRNKGRYHYHWVVAQEQCDKCKRRMCRHRKFSLEMRKEIIALLVNEQWSPEQIKDYMLMKKLTKGKNAQALAKTVVAMMTPFIGNIKSITTDNGSEFAEHKVIAQRLKTKVYFAHPYSSWKKGNIENTNKLISQYIPKGTDFEQYSEQQIKQIQMKINARPRKKLNFSTPKQEFYNFLI